MFLAVPLLCVAADSAEKYRFTYINKASYGLSYDAVRCLLEDSRGFVWLGTSAGLNRYDGVRIKTYGAADLLVSAPHIYTLMEDSEGNVLIGTDDGLVIYDYKEDSFRRPLGDDLFSDRVYAIKSDSKGRVWIGTRKSGLHVYDPETSRMRPYPVYAGDGQEIVNVYRIAVGRNDRVWLASYCDNIYSLCEDKEICFAAGFSSSSYFAKCFRQKYGVLPNEYVGQTTETVQDATLSPKNETN